jgi:Alcohol dehydrogenase GroES-like domain
MQAIVIDATGQRGRLEDIPAPAPGSRDAVIRVTFAGINPIDWKVRDGHAGAIDHLPFVLGQDFAGVVESVGNEMREVSVGDRVFGVARGAGSYAQRTLVTAGVGVRARRGRSTRSRDPKRWRATIVTMQCWTLSVTTRRSNDIGRCCAAAARWCRRRMLPTSSGLQLAIFEPQTS